MGRFTWNIEAPQAPATATAFTTTERSVRRGGACPQPLHPRERRRAFALNEPAPRPHSAPTFGSTRPTAYSPDRRPVAARAARAARAAPARPGQSALATPAPLTTALPQRLSRPRRAFDRPLGAPHPTGGAGRRPRTRGERSIEPARRSQSPLASASTGLRGRPLALEQPKVASTHPGSRSHAPIARRRPGIRKPHRPKPCDALQPRRPGTSGRSASTLTTTVRLQRRHHLPDTGGRFT